MQKLSNNTRLAVRNLAIEYAGWCAQKTDLDTVTWGRMLLDSQEHLGIVLAAEDTIKTLMTSAQRRLDATQQESTL